MNPPRIECRDCHHAMKLQGEVYVHSGKRAADCTCACSGKPLEGITYFIPKHMRAKDPNNPEDVPDAWKQPAGALADAGGVDVSVPSPPPGGSGAAGGSGTVPAGVAGDAQPAEGAGTGDAGGGNGTPVEIRHLDLTEGLELRMFTNSELTTFRRCKRKWWLVFHRRLKLKYEDPSGVRGLGTRLHLALAARYSGSSRNPMDVLIESFAEDRAKLEEMGRDPTCTLRVDELTLELKKDEEYGIAMLEGYFEWLAETGVDADLEIIGEEVRVSVKSGIPGVGLTGKLDVRVRQRQDGSRLFIDHKSVGNFKEPALTLPKDTQMLHYHLLEFMTYLGMGYEAADAEATRTGGGLYNMLRRVKRTAAANPPFYMRLPIHHNIHELRSYWLRAHGEIADIIALEQRLMNGEDPRYVAYPTPKRDCTWDCDFNGICTMFDDNSRVEDLITEHYEQHDPMARYRDAKVEGSS